MSTIRIEGVGEWEMPESFTYREAGAIFRDTGLRIGDFYTALVARDPSALAVLAVVAAKRVDAKFDPDTVLDLELGKIEILDDDDEPAAEVDGGPPAEGSGGGRGKGGRRPRSK